jgi:hypothetical protein
MMGYLSLSRAEVQFAIYICSVFGVLSTRNESVRQLTDVLYLDVVTNSHFLWLPCTHAHLSCSPKFVPAVSVSVI